MCPYYNENAGVCKIYKTSQDNYHKDAYCRECRYSFKDCPNYKQLEKVYGGNPPPPSHY